MFVWTRRKQFWKPFYKTLPKLRKISAQTPEGSEDFFQKKLFFVKVFVWTRRKQFWQLCRIKFCQKSENVSVKVQKVKKFSKNYFFLSKCSSKRAETSFGNISTKLCRRSESVSFKVRKKVEKTFFKKFVFQSKWLYKHVESSFDNFAKSKCLPKSEKVSLKVQKMKKCSKNQFFQPNCSTELGESNFDNEKIPQNSEDFQLRVQKNEVFKEIFFIKVFAWRRRKRTRKHFYKTLPKVRKCFMQSPKENEDFFHEKNCFSSKSSYERVESNFDKKKFHKIQKIFHSKSKKMKFSKKFFFNQSVRLKA